MTGTDPLTMDSLLILAGFAGTLWAIFSVYSHLRAEQREQRIILNIVCRHLNISLDEILGGKDK